MMSPLHQRRDNRPTATASKPTRKRPRLPGQHEYMQNLAFASPKLAFMPSKRGRKAKPANVKKLEVYVDGRVHRLMRASTVTKDGKPMKAQSYCRGCYAAKSPPPISFPSLLCCGMLRPHYLFPGGADQAPLSQTQCVPLVVCLIADRPQVTEGCDGATESMLGL